MKETRITLAQGIGFAITLLIVLIGGWVQINNRVAVLETRYEIQKTMNEGVSKDLKELQKTLVEIKVSQAEILQKIIEREKKDS